MTDDRMTEADRLDEARLRLVAAILPHAPFDGWGPAAFRAAIAESGVDPDLARLAAPRGGLDLAVAFHKAGDAEMTARMSAADLDAMRYRDRVVFAVRARIEIAAQEREAVRRAVTLFALPFHAMEGSRLIWGTADAIWTGLGDTSRDYNWYSKRAILSAVYSSTVLYWLGDDSPDYEATWAFLDRRIEGVMQFEKTKRQLRENRALAPLLWAPRQVLSRLRAPMAVDTGTPVGLPGGKR